MTVWTKKQFRKDSKKYFSMRDGTIAEIDTGLDEYHGKIGTDEESAKLEDLYALIDKFETEKALKHQADPTKQSTKRKNSIARLRVQVENARWQLEYDSKSQERADFKEYFKKKRKKDKDDKILADWLEKLKVQVKQGAANTNRLKRDLHAAIEGFFDPAGPKTWLPAWQKGFPWQGTGGYVGDSPNYRLADPVRIATVDLESVVGGGEIEYVMFGSKDDPDWATDSEKSAIFYKVLQEKDALVSFRQSERQVAEQFPADMRKLLEDYLRALLTVDLQEQVALVERALASEKGFRAVVHVDYYATRSTTQVGLHKDTTGNNLFAVLHYLNDAPMLGPEYIDDPAPIRSVNPGYYYERFWSAIGDEYKRQGAPWAVCNDGAYCTWPDALLEGLQTARESTKSDVSRGKLASSILPKDGLATFVDELVFHATPIEGHRTDSDKTDAVRYLSAGVTVTSLVKGKFPTFDAVNIFGTKNHATRIRRRMSAHYDNGTHIETGLTIPGSTSGGVRKFFRLWICVVPKHWYESLPPYP